MDMLHQHTSQVYEWLPFNEGIINQVPIKDADRRKWLGQTWKNDLKNSTLFMDVLIRFYGKGACKIDYCEAFQDSQYGTRLTDENIYYYFPFLDSENLSEF